MTVTKRKQRPRTEQTDDTATLAPALEGIKASCDSCSADITHSVHVRCAETNSNGSLTCPDFDLCVPCFLSGKSIGPHRCHHAYRIISSHAFPIFDKDWGADEELLLIEGAELYGLGNWADIAENVGGRTKEECEKHYREIYIQSEDYPLPVVGGSFGTTEEFQSRKKRRLEEMQARPLALPPPKPLASAPTCHEIGGYMPGRLEFETEYENEAETLVKDMEFAKVYRFGGDQQPAPPPPPAPPTTEDVKPDGEAAAEDAGEEDESELELKMTVLEMFNEKYDKRVASKDLIWDRGLVNYKQLLANERKRSKEERDLILRTKVFARIQTGLDHETFVDGLVYDLALRRRIAELQEYRRNGITSLAEGERYDHAKSQRLSAKAANYRDSLVVSYDRVASRGARLPGALSDRKTPSSSSLGSKSSNAASVPLTLASSSSFNLLTPLEQQLCSTLRILPRPFLFLKETLLREWSRLGGEMGSEDARRCVAGPKDGGRASGEWGEKIERVWEFLVDVGGLRKGAIRRKIEEEIEGDGEDESGKEGDASGAVSEDVGAGSENDTAPQGLEESNGVKEDEGVPQIIDLTDHQEDQKMQVDVVLNPGESKEEVPFVLPQTDSPGGMDGVQ